MERISMELFTYMERGVKGLASAVSKYYLFNRKGHRFLKTFLPALKDASRKREGRETAGEHVPLFLIASIASACNLHCAGCYARANGMCTDTDCASDLTAGEWSVIFSEAAALGISFILLAGGEPLLRRDVIEAAAREKSVAFPVFTNGTLLDDGFLALFDESRNLVPVLSLEGGSALTDARRGGGVSEQLYGVMRRFHKKKLLYAVSVTVTHENMSDVTSRSFIRTLRNEGCGILFYVEYVPAEEGTDAFVLTQKDTAELNDRVAVLKRLWNNMSILSFPGDEAKMGGCLAAGRGFFHISPTGAAEPCPFSPYSKLNVKEAGIEACIRSEFFKKVREISCSDVVHYGGCTLHLHKEEVSAL